MSGNAKIWMPLFIGDLVADTMDLTTLEFGSYMKLIIHQWRRGHMRIESIPAITGLSPDAWSIAQASLKDRLSIDEAGLVFVPRVDKEKGIAEKKTSVFKERARKAAAKRWESHNAAKQKAKENTDASSIAQALLEQCPSPSPLPLNSPSPLRSEGEARRAPLAPPVSGLPGSEDGKRGVAASTNHRTSVGMSKVVAMRGRMGSHVKKGESITQRARDKTQDARVNEFRHRITDFWGQANDRESNACPWGKAESTALSSLLEASAMTAGDLQTCLDNRWVSIQSSCFPPGMRPAQWIASLPNFLSGPINQFGDLLRQRKGRTL